MTTPTGIYVSKNENILNYEAKKDSYPLPNVFVKYCICDVTSAKTRSDDKLRTYQR